MALIFCLQMGSLFANSLLHTYGQKKQVNKVGIGNALMCSLAMSVSSNLSALCMPGYAKVLKKTEATNRHDILKRNHYIDHS